MIIYNVTVKVDLPVVEEWLEWMKEVHLPEVVATGYFEDAEIRRLLQQDETDGVTYICQYRAHNMERLHEYEEKAAPALQKDHADKFGNHVVAFRTLMERVH